MNTSTLSLHDLLRLNFTDSITWLSGESKANLKVNWVAASLNDAQEGDTLLVEAVHLDDEYLSKAEEKGVTSILVIGKNPPRELKIPGDLPVAFISGQDNLRETQRALLTFLTNQHAARVERSKRVHTQLTQLAIKGGHLEGLAHRMHEISGRGILVQDKRMRLLAGYPSPPLQSTWEDIIEQLTSPVSLPDSLRNRDQAGKQSLILHQSIPGGLARIITPITVDEVARGYLSVIGMEGEIDELDSLVAEEGALVCAVEMARAKAVRETEKRLQGDLLTALLQEDLSPRDASLWLQTMGLDQDQEHAALHFAWDTPSPPSRRRLETIVNGEVVRLGAKVIISPTGSDVICFCQVTPGNSRPVEALELSQNALIRAYEEYPDAHARCGVGTPAPDLNNWQNSFREAGQALEMARRLLESKPLYYPDLSVYRLLMLVEDNRELLSFQEEVLGTLLSHDGGKNLIETLEAYFKNNGNLSQTAETLFIHRNTLFYRMERIAEITGLDLSNPDTSLAVQIALRIYRMLGEK